MYIRLVRHSMSNIRTPIKILKENGAIYEDKPVVLDGNIVTANGPLAAVEFEEKLVNLLNT